ncbi:GspH/FimT family pseudopilin [Variovorax ureilyticus]|uniref:GspH/FimT family pseudopilin n=1 Tax=Variovorax ureilyticus TaxID=1836198 RepID=UPI003D67B2FD
MHQPPLLRARGRGFTLIELLVTVTVAVILLTVAVPAFDSVSLSSRLNAYATSLVAANQLARSEAIKRNASVTLCASADGSTCATDGHWEAGWIVLSGTTVLRQQPAAASGYLMREAGGASSLNYDATGLGATQASINICRATPTAGSQERVVKISATGRTSITSTTLGACA